MTTTTTITLTAALVRYESERLPNVVTTDTLRRHVRTITSRIDDVSVADQASVSAAVDGYIEARRAEVADATVRERHLRPAADALEQLLIDGRRPVPTSDALGESAA